MESKNILILAAAGAGLLLVVWLFASVLSSEQAQEIAAVTNFEECAAAGYPIMESFPRQCNTPDGGHFVEEIPVNSGMEPGQGMVFNGCAVAGCSGQLCVSAIEAENIMTTCEYRAEYACYREASCEPQADGACGWTVTAELRQCLANPPAMEGEPQAI